MQKPIRGIGALSGKAHRKGSSHREIDADDGCAMKAAETWGVRGRCCGLVSRSHRRVGTSGHGLRPTPSDAGCINADQQDQEKDSRTHRGPGIHVINCTTWTVVAYTRHVRPLQVNAVP